MPTAFVTGCASGFGHALAELLLARGWRVIATDRITAHWPATLGAPRPDLAVHRVDVRDRASIDAAVAAAGEVDLVVNNAGYALFAPLEEADLERVRDLFDVNVLGPARVLQATLPSLRRTRGMVVQISSVAGQLAFPGSGYYAATKHALEAVSEALALEITTFGIRVRVIEPGNFATGLQAAAVSPSSPAGSPYSALQDRWDARRGEVLAAGQDPVDVARAVEATWHDPATFARVVVGHDAVSLLRERREAGDDAWVRQEAERLQRPAGD